jgi:hypothetical protein
VTVLHKVELIGKAIAWSEDAIDFDSGLPGLKMKSKIFQFWSLRDSLSIDQKCYPNDGLSKKLDLNL